MLGDFQVYQTIRLWGRNMHLVFGSKSTWAPNAVISDHVTLNDEITIYEAFPVYQALL